MPSLYWAPSEGARDAVRAKLEDMGRVAVDAGKHVGLDILRIDDPDADLIARTLPMIAAEYLRGAALAADRLADEFVWIAIEWRRRFVVEARLFEQVDVPSGAQLDHVEVAGRQFVIVPAEAPEAPRPIRTLRGEPHSRSAVLDDPARFYGEYAEAWVGGANALFAAGQEAAHLRGLSQDMIVLGTPEDFGFARDDSEESVNAWRRKRVIDAEAVGFSLGDWQGVTELAARHGVADDMAAFAGQVGQWRANGYSYGVAAVLIGLADPPVVIPMGSVYQQPTMGARVQNLATAQSATKMVPAGAKVPIVLPAYCLNRSFSAPNGGPVAPTSLIYAAASGTQQDVWSGIRGRYEGRS